MRIGSNPRRLSLVAMVLWSSTAAVPAQAEAGRTVTILADGVYEMDHPGEAGGNTTVIIGDRQVFVVDSCLTIMVHAETRRDMDLFGPGSAARQERYVASLRRMLDSRMTSEGTALTADDRTAAVNALTQNTATLDEMKKVKFQTATPTFEPIPRVDSNAAEPRRVGGRHDRSRAWTNPARQVSHLPDSGSAEKRGGSAEREAGAVLARHVPDAR